MTARYRATVLASALVVLLGSVAALQAYLHSRNRFDPERLATYYAALRVRTAVPVAPDQVLTAIGGAVGYLLRINDESGQFDYLANMEPTVSVPPEYDILRHAGTIYSLGMANRISPHDETVYVMRRATRFMRSCCILAVQDGRMSVLRDPPGMISRNGADKYQLGGAGLGIAALTSLDEARPGEATLDEMRALGRFGRFMQMPSGEFYAYFEPSLGGRQALGRSLYYPGEMALGWLLLYQRDPSREWFDSAVEALTYLATQRSRAGTAPADHWSLIATAKLFEVSELTGIPVPREVLVQHALQVCDAILEDSYFLPSSPEMAGSLVNDGLVTPTAARLEGLLAALQFLPRDHPITPHVESAVQRGIDFLVRAQVKSGPFSGAMPGAIVRLRNSGRADEAKFNRLATEVRIDYVQHALSALVMYYEGGIRTPVNQPK